MTMYEYFTQASNVEWCEDKYVITPYIAEFWNTLTGIPYMYMAIVGVLTARTRFERALWTEVFFIGFGTSMFHGTLTLGGQLVDEIAIILFLMTSSMRLNHVHQLYQSVIYIASVALMLIYPQINCYMLFVVGLAVAAPLGNRMIKERYDRLQIFMTGALTIAGIICWSIDKFECGGWGYLHALWHIIMLPVIKNVIALSTRTINFVEHFSRSSRV